MRMIAGGNASVIVDSVPAGVIERGNVLGELAMLKIGSRARATVRGGPLGCRMLEIDRRALDRVLGNLEDVARRDEKGYRGLLGQMI